MSYGTVFYNDVHLLINVNSKDIIFINYQMKLKPPWTATSVSYV